jgi:hypothetical protein
MRQAFAAAGALVTGIISAGSAVAQSASLSLLCSPDTNGGTLVNRICMLPGAPVGQLYEGFLLTSSGAVDAFTITSGGVPSGLFMPALWLVHARHLRRGRDYRRRHAHQGWHIHVHRPRHPLWRRNTEHGWHLQHHGRPIAEAPQVIGCHQ